MKRENIYLWITVFILLAGNLIFFTLSKERHFNTSLENIIVTTSTMKSYAVEELLMHMEFDYALLKDVSVIQNDYANIFVDTLHHRTDSLMLSGLLQDNKVVFVFAQYACNTCVSEQLIILNKLGKKIGYENIIIIADKNSHNIELFLKSNNCKLNLYETNTNNLGLFDIPPVSALLIYTRKNRIATSFVVSMDTKEYARSFYKFIEKQYVTK